ncbi:MAG: hypothetical protein KDA61_17535 [Planctomycetales bacterium]|nr:hypothetical protein [Planctomycetales bacterium]
MKFLKQPSLLVALSLISWCSCSGIDAHAGAVAPTPYLSASDSPWTGGAWSYFYLEDFEDGVLDQPGVVAEGAQSILLAGGTFTDSVDADDGTIDGSGSNGRSQYTNAAAAGITYRFDETSLGALPSHAGIVWTDLSGDAEVFLEAFDAANVSLGVLDAGALNDGVSTGQTAEDRFLGWEHAAGISAIRIYQSASDMEVDHLQYGLQIPEPAACFLWCGVLLATFSRRPIR